MLKARWTAALVTAAFVGLPAAHAIDVTVGGEAGVDVTVGGTVEAGANVEAGAAAGMAEAAEGGGSGMIAEDGTLTLRTDAGVEAGVAVDGLIGQSIHTDDEVEFGVVAEVISDGEGHAILVVETAEGWMEGVERIAVYASAVTQTEAGLTLDTSEEDLRASIEAGMMAGAEAGAGG